MGCDIHMVLETKYNNKWVGINNFNGVLADAVRVSSADYKTKLPELADYIGFKCRSRNYNLFAALAGVRGDGPPARGVPDDASDLALMEIDNWGSDGHSHSWGMLREVGPAFLAHYKPSEVLSEERVDALARLFNIAYSISDNELDNYRLVYWFDN